jgi:hypothetical protein
VKKPSQKRSARRQDRVYFLKILLYMILGLQWVWLIDEQARVWLTLPIGLGLGLLFTRHERFRIDRKIEYAVLLVAALVGFLLEAGVYFRT